MQIKYLNDIYKQKSGLLTSMLITMMMFLFTSNSFAQEQITTSVDGFNSLKVFNALEVELIKSDEAKVIVAGKRAEDVRVKLKNKMLKISVNISGLFNSKDAIIQVFYKDPINVIDVNEGAKITARETIKQSALELRAQEGSMIEIDLSLNYLKVKSVSGSRVETTGFSQTQDVVLSLGGIYNGYGLRTAQTTISAATGGIGHVLVNDVLNAKVKIGGEIYYRGNPSALNKDKILGGKIEKTD
ncbi:head GIN domain-containing protein [Aureivirga sp. CE67]|uniref:head GIN domain-containing protein n=1 Tax=Aureivirga sp. CE67 TaxID=1788983 RepID=UPI0018C995AE|nr:head GIN domain-containing protein [Aureivirga sp. CE67]